MTIKRRNVVRIPIAHVSRADAPGHQANVHLFDQSRRAHCNIEGDTQHLIKVFALVLEDLARMEGKTLHDVMQELEIIEEHHDGS